MSYTTVKSASANSSEVDMMDPDAILASLERYRKELGILPPGEQKEAEAKEPEVKKVEDSDDDEIFTKEELAKIEELKQERAQRKPGAEETKTESELTPLRSAVLTSIEDEEFERIEANLAQRKEEARKVLKEHIHEQLARRVVITNLAADAGVEELYKVFHEWGIFDIKILDERHPTNRTRIAYVDFYEAKKAGYAYRLGRYENIFGLRIFCHRPTPPEGL